MIHKHKNTIGAALIALIIGMGIGYTGDQMFARPSTLSQNASGFGGGQYGGAGGMMRGGARSGGMVGGFLTGTVAAKDQGSVTLNTRDGSSRVILVTPNTTVSKSTNGTLDDVTTGATIIVSGTTNSDGSLSASLIQLRPATPQTAQ